METSATPESATPESATPTPPVWVAPEPATPEPVTPEPVTPEPVMPGSTLPRPVTPATPSRRSQSWLNIFLAVAALVAVGGITFAVGRATAPAAAATGRSAFNGGAGADAGYRNFEGGNGIGFGAGAVGAGNLTIRGTVSAVTASSITLTLSSGGTIEIPISASTTYHQQASGSAGDVQVGRQVAVEMNGIRGVGGAGPNGGAASSPNPGVAATPNPSGAPRQIGTAVDITVTSP